MLDALKGKVTEFLLRHSVLIYKGDHLASEPGVTRSEKGDFVLKGDAAVAYKNRTLEDVAVELGNGKVGEARYVFVRKLANREGTELSKHSDNLNHYIFNKVRTYSDFISAVSGDVIDLPLEERSRYLKAEKDIAEAIAEKRSGDKPDFEREFVGALYNYAARLIRKEELEHARNVIDYARQHRKKGERHFEIRVIRAAYDNAKNQIRKWGDYKDRLKRDHAKGYNYQGLLDANEDIIKAMAFARQLARENSEDASSFEWEYLVNTAHLEGHYDLMRYDLAAYNPGLPIIQKFERFFRGKKGLRERFIALGSSK